MNYTLTKLTNNIACALELCEDRSGLWKPPARVCKQTERYLFELDMSRAILAEAYDIVRKIAANEAIVDHNHTHNTWTRMFHEECQILPESCHAYWWTTPYKRSEWEAVDSYNEWNAFHTQTGWNMFPTWADWTAFKERTEMKSGKYGYDAMTVAYAMYAHVMWCMIEPYAEFDHSISERLGIVRPGTEGFDDAPAIVFDDAVHEGDVAPYRHPNQDHGRVAYYDDDYDDYDDKYAEYDEYVRSAAVAARAKPDIVSVWTAPVVDNDSQDGAQDDVLFYTDEDDVFYTHAVAAEAAADTEDADVFYTHAVADEDDVFYTHAVADLQDADVFYDCESIPEGYGI